MDKDLLLRSLLRTFEDGRMSQTEHGDIARKLVESPPPPADRRAVGLALVGAVRDRMSDPSDRAALDWLRDSLGMLWTDAPAQASAGSAESAAYFGPEDPMVETLQDLLRAARKTIDVAMFTITDNRLAGALLDAHRRRVAVRVLTDDDKQWDEGSDVRQLSDAGLPVAVDRSPFHFHHKFALIDGATLVTGSYNWTRGAANDNRENFLVTKDRTLVTAFGRAFQQLWGKLYQA
jgi:phosphatidylserine/phosphatidylglycerophosphate/cardiolipin synthase-like enzyme